MKTWNYWVRKKLNNCTIEKNKDTSLPAKFLWTDFLNNFPFFSDSTSIYLTAWVEQ